jgi:hypothetical protein
VSAESHREAYNELCRRVKFEAGLGEPVPKLGVSLTLLLVDLLCELGACVLELELREAIR